MYCYNIGFSGMHSFHILWSITDLPIIFLLFRFILTVFDMIDSAHFVDLLNRSISQIDKMCTTIRLKWVIDHEYELGQC